MKNLKQHKSKQERKYAGWDKADLPSVRGHAKKTKETNRKRNVIARLARRRNR